MPRAKGGHALALAMFVSLASFAAGFAATSAKAPVDPGQPLNAGQIDQLVGPVALYPDTLLAKILIASTYPLEVAEAARWIKKMGLKDAALEEALVKMSWDDSIKTLVHAPPVLVMMASDIDSIAKLGEAVLAQPADVFAGVQRLRQKAQDAGKLETGAEETVANDTNTIYIMPTNPATLHIPCFNPVVSYGVWEWDDSPPLYWPAPEEYPNAAGFFSAAINGTRLWTAAIDWRTHRLISDTRTDFNRVRERGQIGAASAWRHDPEHRHDMLYARPALQRAYGKGRLPGAEARRAFRGFEQASAGSSGDGRAPAARAPRKGDAFEGLARPADSNRYSTRGFSSRGKRGGIGGLRTVGFSSPLRSAPQ